MIESVSVHVVSSDFCASCRLHAFCADAFIA